MTKLTDEELAAQTAQKIEDLVTQTKLSDDELEKLRSAKGIMHLTAGGAHRAAAHIDALTTELSQARAENAAILAANRDAHLHFDALMADHKAAQAELAALRAGAPDGWVLVPVGPDAGMQQSGAMQIAMNAQRVDTAEAKALHVYRAMLAAAPQPPAQAVARPEAAVKAEALREVAATVDLPRATMADAAHIRSWLIDRADRLENGGN